MTQTEDLAQFDPASFEHIPVLLNECLDGLNIDPAGTYLDGTAGGALAVDREAFAREITERICAHPNITVE